MFSAVTLKGGMVRGNAKSAFKYFGAIYGVNSGMQGSSYAIVTKDLQKGWHPSIHNSVIELQIELLYAYARDNKEMQFFIAYSASSFLLNGYNIVEMAAMFKCARIPGNIVFEKGFYKIIKNL